MGTNFDGNLNDLFKNLDFMKGPGMNAMLNTMMKNAQLKMLKQLRKSIDDAIRRSVSEETEGLDPYEVLGVKPDARREDIDRAYKRKAFDAHPDHGGSNQEMVKINAAYQAIRMIRGWTK